MAELTIATAIQPVEAIDEHCRYTAELDPQWCIGTKLNGGYLLAILARAAVRTAGAEHPHPIAVSATFVAAPEPGPAEVAVRVLRRGRTAAQLHAAMRVAGALCVEALVTCGRLEPAAAPYWSGVQPPDLPTEEACSPVRPVDPRLPVPLFDAVSVRMDAVTAGFATGRPTGCGELSAWVRVSPRPPDPYALLVALDTLPPATFDLGLVAAWVPTLELTAYLRALPAPGALLVRQRARLVTADRVDEECDVWDATGALVASASQLAAIRLPETPDGRA